MVVVAINAILAAIAMPNLMEFQARDRQAEAQVNVRDFLTAAKVTLSNKAHWLLGLVDLLLRRKIATYSPLIPVLVLLVPPPLVAPIAQQAAGQLQRKR